LFFADREGLHALRAVHGLARGCVVPEVEGRHPMTITARSYCTGYGGLEMSVRASFGDFDVLSHSDIKPAAVALLGHRYPDVPNLGDMREIDYTALEAADLMIGSWPCQPHSAAGKRLGEADPRDLWPEYLRAIDATRPAIFFGENVARIASNGELRRVVRSLAQRGYVGAWRSVRASDVGACHRRDRMFLVAVDPAADALGVAGRLAGYAGQGEGPGSPRLGQEESGRRDLQSLTLLPTPAARDRKGPECRGPRSDGYARSVLQTDLANAVLNLLPTPKATDGTKGGPGMRGSSGDLMLPSAVMALLPTPTADARRARSTSPAVAQARLDSGRRNLEDTVSAHADRWGIYAAAIARHERAVSCLAPNPTQLSEKTGNPQLSARFVEWMMMVPEGHVTGVPNLVDSPRKSERNAMLSLLGDGVVPAQGAAAFAFLLQHMDQRLAAVAA
jgi:DNA (cytosine-5)-methyltransferase 1